MHFPVCLKLFKFIFYLGNMTGMVGTALYVGPEVQGSTKATYNQVQLTLKPFVMVYMLSESYFLWNLYFCVSLESGPVQFGYHLVWDVLQTNDHGFWTYLRPQPAQKGTCVPDIAVETCLLADQIRKQCLWFHPQSYHCNNRKSFEKVSEQLGV